MARKPNANAILKNLPAKTQAAIWEMLTVNGTDGKPTSYEAVAARLAAEWDIECSETTLGEFFRWYPTTQRLAQAASFTETLMEEFRKNPALKLEDEQVTAIGQAVFEAEAIRARDTDTFIALQRVALERKGMAGRQRIEQEKLKQGDRRITLLEKKAEAFDTVKKAVSEDGRLSPERLADIEKQLKLR